MKRTRRRRTLMAGGAAGALVLLAASCGGSPPEPSSSTEPRPELCSAIPSRSRDVLRPDDDGLGAVAGQVHRTDGRPLESAIVDLPDHPRMGALTDSLGVFRIDSVPVQDTAIVRFQLLGYRTQEHQVRVFGNGTEYLCVLMNVQPVILHHEG